MPESCSLFIGQVWCNVHCGKRCSLLCTVVIMCAIEGLLKDEGHNLGLGSGGEMNRNVEYGRH